MRNSRRLLWSAVGVAACLLLYSGGLAIRIVHFGNRDAAVPSDAAVVLGAAVHGNAASPVFQERIRHAVSLFHEGTIRFLIFTGGFGDGATHSEAAVAHNIAIQAGAPANAILIEERSRTTRENLHEAKQLMESAGLRSAIIVSDPLHMMRALRMAGDLAMDTVPSPTTATCYRGLRVRLQFLARELYFYTHYLLTGH